MMPSFRAAVRRLCLCTESGNRKLTAQYLRGTGGGDADGAVSLRGILHLKRGANDVAKTRLMQGGEQIVVVRFLVHHMERHHVVGEVRRHRESPWLPARGFLGRPWFGAGCLNPLTGRHSLVRDRVLIDIRLDPQHPQRFARLIGGHGQGDMPEEPLGPAPEDAQSRAVTEKPKRCGVMHDPHNPTPLYPVPCLAHMPTEYAGQRDLRIRETPIRRLPIGDRFQWSPAVRFCRAGERRRGGQGYLKPTVSASTCRP